MNALAVIAMYDFGRMKKENADYLINDSRKYAEEVAGALPYRLGMRAKYQHERILEKKTPRDANLFMTDLKGLAQSIKFTLATDDNKLCQNAEIYADRCQRFLSVNGGDVEAALKLALDFAVNVTDILPPDVEKFGAYGSLMRLCDAKFWRRALRKQHARGLEKLEIKAGAVHFKAGIYSSDDNVFRRREQKARNARILENVKAVNDEGQEYTLAELSALNVSNPKIRRMELMTRIRGFEEIATERGLVGEFYTLTAPSKFHAYKKGKNGRAIRNEKFNGATPSETQRYLAEQWERVRAHWAEYGIKPFGFRVVEPHHDSTPHWHLLLFMPFSQIKKARETFRYYALQVDGNETGAKKQRFKAVSIDPKKGSAAGYVAKYISKAIDGYAVDYDLFGVDAVKAAERIETWASTWGIRQFQQIGGASVTVWRELRRLEDEQPSALLEAARQAADAGDWAEYCRLNWNGEIKLMREAVEDYGQYGDLKAEPILGLYDNLSGMAVVTRNFEWSIGQGVKFVKESGDTENQRKGEALRPWTCVNNYKRVIKQINEVSEMERLRNQAYNEYLRQKQAGESWQGGFFEFLEEWQYLREVKNGN